MFRGEKHFPKAFPITVKKQTHGYGNLPEKHGHDFVELVYVIKGKATHLFEGEQYQIEAGDVFIINPGEVHTYDAKPNEKIEIINCLFLPNLVSSALLQELEISSAIDYFYVHPFLNKSERFNHLLNLRGEASASVLRLLEDIIEELQEKRMGFPTLVRLQFIQLLIMLSRYYTQETKHDKVNQNDKFLLVHRICGYLERHSEQKITLELLSALFHTSPRQLNRLFKQEIKQSVIETLHHIRVEKAKRLLSNPDHKIIEVALAAGYDDPSFFSHLFKRIEGCSPGQYRESLQND